MLSGEGEQKREEEWARRVLKRLDLKMRAGQTQAVTNDMTPSKHTYILYCIAPPWGLLRHTEIKKIKDKNIYNKETKMKKKSEKGGIVAKTANPEEKRQISPALIDSGIGVRSDGR